MKRGKTLSSVLNVVCVLLLGFTTFSALTLSQVKIVAYAADYGGEPTSPSGDNTSSSSSATATVHVNSACSLTSIVTTAHNAIMSNGTISNDVGSTKLTVKCNDGGGFAIYAIGYSNDEYGNTTMIGNTNSSLTIPTGTDTTLGNTTSHWAMKVAKDTTSYLPANLTIENSYDSYSVVPTGYTKVASYASSTDGASGTGSSILATYSIRISNTQPANTYVGKVKYTMVHPNMVDNSNKPVAPIPSNLLTANYIIYAPNADDIEGDMSSLGYTADLHAASPKAGRQSASSSTVNLIAPNFKREGYGFAGWSTAYDVSTATNPVIYGPNEIVSTNPNADRGLNVSGGAVLYPVWIASAGNLQNWTGCSSLTTVAYNETTGILTATLSSITALTDTRDNIVYTVAKLADGNCWMVENLKLDAEFTRSATDIAKAQGYGTSTTYGNFIGLADSENGNVFHGNMPVLANSFYSTDGSTTVNVGTGTVGTNSSPSYRLPRYSNINTDFSLTASYNTNPPLSMPNNGDQIYYHWYSYGNYYNWPAAMANTARYDAYSGDDGSDAAGTSLCPAGWHLPLGDASSGTLANGANDPANRVSSFSYLDRKMGGTGTNNSTNSITGANMSTYWLKFPNNYTVPGYRLMAGTNARGSTGHYWSSSANNGQVFSLAISTSGVNPISSLDGKYQGQSVRCVANSPETWQFNNSIEISSLVGEEFSVTFYSNNGLFNSIRFTAEGGKIGNCMNYDNMSCIFSDKTMGWGGQDVYNTITIVGGNDYNDSDFRTWLSNNATRL